jgi:hypothetical protein
LTCALLALCMCCCFHTSISALVVWQRADEVIVCGPLVTNLVRYHLRGVDNKGGTA